jgi:hypothetical protein
VRFEPALLRRQEFLSGNTQLRYLDVAGRWVEIDIPEGALAYTWCQVPVVYHLVDDHVARVEVVLDDGQAFTMRGRSLSAEMSAELFERSGRVSRVDVWISERDLFVS